MNVRQMSTTTLSLALLFFALYLLFSLIRRDMHNISSVISLRFSQGNLIGAYHPFLISASYWVIIITGVIDAALNNYVNLAIFSSLKAPLVLAPPIIIFSFIPQFNNYVFWGMTYITVIIGVYWTFRRFSSSNRSEGYQTLLDFLKSARTYTATGQNHVWDQYAVFGISTLIAVLHILLSVSFAIFMIANIGVTI